MDDTKKTIVERFSDAVREVVDVAATAAMKAMEQPEADPQKVVRTANEQIRVPEGTDAAAMPVPLAKASKTPKPNMSGRITPTYDFPVPDSPMPLPKKKPKAAVKNSKKAIKKKAPKKAAPKKSKKAAKKKVGKKKVAKKTSRKPAKRKTKKSKR
jgi:hypothetical protein